LRRYQVKFEDGFDNILVVDGVPVIEETKIEKLLAKVAKEFNRKGSAIRPDDIYVPLTESKMTKGCVSSIPPNFFL
jgi:translation initiation factor 3 subunit B